MADEQAPQGQQAQPAAGAAPAGTNQPDQAFFDCVNAYLELTNSQSRQYGDKRISMAALYAAARFNAHAYLASVKPIHAAGERGAFLDYMGTMYRRMLNEHLDGLGEERGIDVGESELAAEYAAAGVQIGRAAPTPAANYVAAAGATPPASNE